MSTSPRDCEIDFSLHEIPRWQSFAIRHVPPCTEGRTLGRFVRHGLIRSIDDRTRDSTPLIVASTILVLIPREGLWIESMLTRVSNRYGSIPWSRSRPRFSWKDRFSPRRCSRNCNSRPWRIFSDRKECAEGTQGMNNDQKSGIQAH